MKSFSDLFGFKTGGAILAEDWEKHLQSSIIPDIRAGKPFELSIDNLNRNFHRQLENILLILLVQYERSDLQNCLHSCMVEIVSNAIRANEKFIYFRENGYSTDDPDRRFIMERFKFDRLEDHWSQLFRDRSLELGLFVKLHFEHSVDGLTMACRNNIMLKDDEDRRIRRKMKQAMHVKDLMEFYARYADDIEGEGLGFALSVMYLKAENLDPALFRVGPQAGATVARLEVPFSHRFSSQRFLDNH